MLSPIDQKEFKEHKMMSQKSGCQPPLLSILIIDSNRDILDIERILLEEEGFDVHCAQSGSEALLLLSRINEPNLILLDMQIEDMTGAEFLNRLQNKFPEIIKCVPIVVSSGHDQNQQSKLAHQNRKPVDVDKLLAEVHRFIERKYETPLLN